MAFGVYAGLAGALEFLSGLGDYLVCKKIMTPFMYVQRPYRYYNLTKCYKLLENVVEKF